MKASLLALTREYHGYLDELFLLHQEALVQRDGSLALSLLALFTEMLQAHMQVEEAIFLPALTSCQQQRWGADLYDKEHRKIERLLASSVGKIEDWQRRGSERRGLIALLDSQRALKNVLEHHEQREEIALLPELDGQLGEREKSALRQQAERLWGELRQAQSVKLAELLARLEG